MVIKLQVHPDTASADSCSPHSIQDVKEAYDSLMSSESWEEMSEKARNKKRFKEYNPIAV